MWIHRSLHPRCLHLSYGRSFTVILGGSSKALRSNFVAKWRMLRSSPKVLRRASKHSSFRYEGWECNANYGMRRVRRRMILEEFEHTSTLHGWISLPDGCICYRTLLVRARSSKFCCWRIPNLLIWITNLDKGIAALDDGLFLLRWRCCLSRRMPSPRRRKGIVLLPCWT